MVPSKLLKVMRINLFTLLFQFNNEHTLSFSGTFSKVWETFAVGLLTFPTFIRTGLVK